MGPNWEVNLLKIHGFFGVGYMNFDTKSCGIALQNQWTRIRA